MLVAQETILMIMPALYPRLMKSFLIIRAICFMPGITMAAVMAGKFPAILDTVFWKAPGLIMMDLIMIMTV